MIVVSDSDILSMFGKVGAVQHLKRLFKEIYILRAFYKKKVLEEEEMRDLVKEIEEKDNTRIKGFEEVFEL